MGVGEYLGGTWPNSSIRKRASNEGHRWNGLFLSKARTSSTDPRRVVDLGLL